MLEESLPLSQTHAANANKGRHFPGVISRGVGGRRAAGGTETTRPRSWNARVVRNYSPPPRLYLCLNLFFIFSMFFKIYF